MKLLEGCKKAVYLVLFLLVIPISAYILYGALDTLKYADVLEQLLPAKGKLLFLFLTSVLLLGLYTGVFRKCSEIFEKKGSKAIIGLFGVMIFLQVLMVLTVRTSLRHDHLKIFDTAVALLQKDTIADTHFKEYFMKYPNNLPLCLFTYGWLKIAAFFHIPKEYWMEVMKFVNLLFMNLGLFCTFSLVCQYRGKKIGNYVLLLLLVNPLWYLLGQMYYTSTISLACSMGAVWLFDRARREEILWKKYIQYVAMGALLASGYKIRATVILTAAALFVYVVLTFQKIRVSRGAIGVFSVLFGGFLVMGAYGQLEKCYAGFDPAKTGYPAIHWVMMSAQGEGQYNSADDAYTGSFSTKEERTEAAIMRLKERVEEMGPKGLLTLWRNKLRVAFSDGTDDYYALFRTMRKPSAVQKYINGGRSDYLSLYLHSYHGMLMGLFMVSLVWRVWKRERNFLDIFLFNICGAYLFYLLWEVDNAYSIPFMLMFVLVAADGIAVVDKGLYQASKRIRITRFLPAVAGGGVLLTAIGTGVIVEQSGKPVREYVVLQDQESSQDLLLQTEFSQTFRARKPFNHVDIWVANWDGAGNDSVYDLMIVDKDGSEVARGEIIGAQAPCMAAYPVAFEKVIPKGEEEYQIKVQLRNKECAVKTDFLYYRSGVWDMYTEGALYAPEEVINVDLAFAVYEEY